MSLYITEPYGGKRARNYHTAQISVKVEYIFHDMVENIVGKGENAGYQHFLLCPQCFLKFWLKVGIAWLRVKQGKLG